MEEPGSRDALAIQGHRVHNQSMRAMANPAFSNPSDPPTPEGAVFYRRMARVSALAALAIIFAGIAYSRESGFFMYAFLFAIPFMVFGLARSGRVWQSWGWALAWVIIALALVPAIVTTVGIARRANRSDWMLLAFLFALLLALGVQLICVRRAYLGNIALGRPLFRAILYYICLLLFAAATLPNWYVPPIVRRENQAADNLRKYSAAMEMYAHTSKETSYPASLSALAALVEAGKIAPASPLDPDLMCAQISCSKNGYQFEYHPLFSGGRLTSYTISARPLAFAETGRRSFLLAADGKIHETREDRDARLADGER